MVLWPTVMAWLPHAGAGLGNPQDAARSGTIGPVNASTGEPEQLTPITRPGLVNSRVHMEPGASRTAPFGPVPTTTFSPDAFNGPWVRRPPSLTQTGSPSTTRLPLVRSRLSAKMAQSSTLGFGPDTAVRADGAKAAMIARIPVTRQPTIRLRVADFIGPPSAPRAPEVEPRYRRP